MGLFGFLWVCFGFLGFFAVLLFSLSSFLFLGVLLYTSCVLGLHSSAPFVYETLLIKKKKKFLPSLIPTSSCWIIPVHLKWLLSFIF
jgi:hypothetical protein